MILCCMYLQFHNKIWPRFIKIDVYMINMDETIVLRSSKNSELHCYLNVYNVTLQRIKLC